MIIAIMINRLSSSNSLIKNKAKILLKQTFMICESTTVVEIVADLTSMSKNLKTVAICLEEITNLIERGISEGVSEKTFKLLFKYVENPD